MAKSQIIKDIANGTVSLETSLKRALVIAHDLKNKALIKWINNELYGYGDANSLPEYRILSGELKISYISGFTAFSNQSVSSSILPKKWAFAMSYNCLDGVKSVEEFSKSEKTMCVSRVEAIPFLKFEHKESISVTNLYLRLSNSSFSRILDCVSKKLMEILLEIDESVGNIDDLDVCLPDERRLKLNKAINVSIGSFVNVGDNNSISKANIAGADFK